jgi:hypothetical protein
LLFNRIRAFPEFMRRRNASLRGAPINFSDGTVIQFGSVKSSVRASAKENVFSSNAGA